MATTNSNAISSNSQIAARGNAQQLTYAKLPDGETLNTLTSLDTVGDIHRLLEVPNGVDIHRLDWDFADLDTNATETIDIDFVMQDDNGDTVLFNGGTTFEDASKDFEMITNGQVVAKNSGIGYIAIKVVAVAATGVAAAAIKFGALYQ